MKGVERVPIIRRNGITIYGRVIDGKGKLGQYEVYTTHSTNELTTYGTFADAEKKFKELEYIAEKHGQEGLRLHFKK